MEIRAPMDELVPLFDALPVVVFFAKDTAGRYTHVNLTLVRRLGLRERAEVLGKTAAELYPGAMGRRHAAQDRRAPGGEMIEEQLEVHMVNKRTSGWCITFKRTLKVHGEICGVLGIALDLGVLDACHLLYDKLRIVLDRMRVHYPRKLPVSTMAKPAGLSVAQRERHFNQVFQLTPQQILTKLRVESAMQWLHEMQPIASIGLARGFADQSAFDRKSKATTGTTPRRHSKPILEPEA